MYAISTQNLTKMFGDFTAVDSLTLDIEAGKICGFLGPNGAGKSTCIRMLCGVLEPTSGSATVLGHDLYQDVEKIKQKIGYMSQKFSLYEELTVYENLDFYAGIYSISSKKRKTRIAEIMELTGLSGSEKEIVAQLSSGWRQRLALGCAIIAQPALVFLDEPTSGVSPGSRRSFFNLIKQMADQGTTVIVTTHFMDEAERCHKIAFISEGKLMAIDKPDILKRDIIKGLLVELNLPSAIDQVGEFENLPYVQECSIHGSVLHVLLETPEKLNSLKEYAGVIPKPITPTLEDVFIALARQHKR